MKHCLSGKIQYFFYNIFLYVYFVITSPFYIFKLFTSEKYRKGLIQRMGFVKKNSGNRIILLHTVSVGELLSSIPLIESIKNNFSEYDIVLSTTTLTGNRVAKSKIIHYCKDIVFFPLDFRWAINRFFRTIRPDIVILVETELWPNFLNFTQVKDIPVLVLNARISEHSYKNYSKMKNFFNTMCKGICKWGVQFNTYADRLTGLGIDAQKISITGSMKIDSAASLVLKEKDICEIYSEWGYNNEVPVLMGGSTHDGEEKILLDVYKNIKEDFEKSVLIIAPRHPERVQRVKGLVDRYGFKCALRSEWKRGMRISDFDVVLIDTVGELVKIYNLATVVFIGKSLVKGGGQNLLEPAVLGKPVICGPLMQNFHDITLWLLRNNGIIQIQNKLDLEKIIKQLFMSKEECLKIGSNARQLILNNAGKAVKQNIDLIKSVLSERRES